MAHDLLWAVVMEEVSPEILQVEDTFRIAAHAALDTLCWVLHHDHSEAFAQNLARIAEKFAEEGIVAVHKPCPESSPGLAN